MNKEIVEPRKMIHDKIRSVKSITNQVADPLRRWPLRKTRRRGRPRADRRYRRCSRLVY